MIYSKLGNKYPLKTAIITGANSGLGLAITRKLLDDQWTIFAIDINIGQLSSIKNELLHFFQIDVSDEEKFADLIKHIFNENKIEVFIHNAGVGEGTLIEDYSMNNWEWIIAINLKAIINGVTVSIPYFKKQKSGLIVTIASAAGYANLPKMSPYNVTKAGVISFTETLAHELSHTNISVKCITPTFFKSNIMLSARGGKSILSSANRVVDNSKVSSDKAADIILRKMHTKSERVMFPNSAYLIWYLKKWAPSFYNFVVRKFLMKKK